MILRFSGKAAFMHSPVSVAAEIPKRADVQAARPNIMENDRDRGRFLGKKRRGSVAAKLPLSQGAKRDGEVLQWKWPGPTTLTPEGTAPAS